MRSCLIRKAIIAAALALPVVSCGPRVQGTYSDRSGAIMLELKSGNKATFTFAGDSANCTYNVESAKIELTCQGQKTEFIIHDDGSLTGPPGNFMGVLRKAKS
jgi:hypothetical protein